MYNKQEISEHITGESKLISIYSDALSQYHLPYITDIGYREVWHTGESFGICSNQFWKLKKQTDNYHQLIAEFYANELLRVKRQNHTCSIRVQGQTYSKFLQEICNHGLGNVLVIFQFHPNKINAYYFLANGKNHNATNSFYNDSNIFYKMVDQISNPINSVVNKYKLGLKATPLLPTYVTDELFTKNINGKKLLIDNNKYNMFTPRQTEILKLLASGCIRSKLIAQEINICPRTAEWHLQVLRHKTTKNSKAELVKYAQELVAS